MQIWAYVYAMLVHGMYPYSRIWTLKKKIVCELISLWVCLSKFVLVSEFCLFLYVVVLEFINVMLYVYVCDYYIYFLVSWLLTLGM